MNAPGRYALWTVLAVLTFASLALAHWGVPEPSRGPGERMYPAARHGENYMHNCGELKGREILNHEKSLPIRGDVVGHVPQVTPANRRNS